MRVRVEEARSCMQAARSQSKVLDSLMQLKRSGRLPGIHGRLVSDCLVCDCERLSAGHSRPTG